jgi:N-acetylmuramic acid 6-phosphate etherase
MKAGTAQKLVLNMLSTAAMIRLGYVTGNRMTNVQTRNVKLRARAERILASESGLSDERAREILDSAGGDLPVALVISQTGCSVDKAKAALKASRGVLAQAIEFTKQPQ